MPVLVWDKVGDKTYESGVDRGVLYLSDGTAIPWNGLTSVAEQFNKDSTPVYYDGMKINDLISIGEFSATMKAVTYPDEFTKLEGLSQITQGVYAADQMPQTFGLSYRTKVGTDLDGDAGYKIHVLYNLTAIPSERESSTLNDSPSINEFEWTLTAVPEEIPNHHPTAHFIIDSRETDPELFAQLEGILYGNETTSASLISMSDLYNAISEWYLIKIIDNLDGTVTIIAQREGFITYLQPDLVELDNLNAVYLDANTVVIYDAVSSTDLPGITIIDNGDGTWTATTNHADVISVDTNGVFQILNANAIFTDPDTYQITSTEA